MPGTEIRAPDRAHYFDLAVRPQCVPTLRIAKDKAANEQRAYQREQVTKGIRKVTDVPHL
jgi:hypothetical protein